jgi:ESCRT-I complex subunit VPS28
MRFLSIISCITVQEVKLHNGAPAQRRVWDDLATIYSIIVSLEFVEKAYVRDTITQAQFNLVLYTSDYRYTQKCSNLLTQYKAILKDAEVQERFGDLETFQKEYNVQFTSATYRLKVGVPATVEHGGNHHHISGPSEPVNDPVNALHIAETVEVSILTENIAYKEIHHLYGCS